MTLVNDFRIGADPEFILVDPPSVIQANAAQKRVDEQLLWGYDHGYYVLEPHPTPALSAREVVKNTKIALNQMARCFPGEYKWRAGAYYQGRERSITLGGHVHIDKLGCTQAQMRAYDRFTSFLQRLDILPATECKTRATDPHGYGRLGDVRVEHGHFEYRSMCSWLFSQKTSLLCLTGVKLLTVAPESLPAATTLTGTSDLVKWLEGFKGDDDVDWMLEKDYFGRSMEAKPDRDLRTVWRVDPENKTGVVALTREAVAPPAPPAPLNEWTARIARAQGIRDAAQEARAQQAPVPRRVVFGDAF